MNTLEEFEKRLSNLLDFIDENKEELIHKHKLGLYLNCSYLDGDDPYDMGAATGNIADISYAIYCFLEKRPQFIEFLEKTIETTKSLANDDRSKRR